MAKHYTQDDITRLFYQGPSIFSIRGSIIADVVSPKAVYFKFGGMVLFEIHENNNSLQLNIVIHGCEHVIDAAIQKIVEEERHIKGLMKDVEQTVENLTPFFRSDLKKV